MDPELKALLDALGAKFEAFKAEHKRELDEVKAKGSASAETVAAVKAANDAITEVRAQITAVEKNASEAKEAATALETELARRRGNRDAIEQERVHARAFFALAAKRQRKAEPTGEPDMEVYRNYRNGFFAYAVRGPEVLLNDPAIRAAVVVGADPLGGFLYPPDTTGRIVQLMFETSPFRQFVSVQSTDKNELEGSADLDEADSGWTAEGGPRGETDTPEVGAWKIPLHEIYAQPKASNRSLDLGNVLNIETWLARKVADRFARREANAIANGNGVTKPRGFLTYPNGVPAGTSQDAWQKIERIVTGFDGGFVAAPNSADFLKTVVGSVKSGYRSRARWAAGRLTYAALRKLKDSDGQYLWQPGLQAGQPDRLEGYPTIEAEDLPIIGVDSLSMAFCDWMEFYQLVENGVIRLVRDNVTSKGWVKFFSYTYRGGDVVNFEAGKLVKFGDA